jgi:hypothetical protein
MATSPFDTLDAKYEAISRARDHIAKMYDDGALSLEAARRALDDLDALELELEAEQDALTLTGPVTPVVSAEQAEQLAGAVSRLAGHNARSAAARAIIREIFVILGAARNA